MISNSNEIYCDQCQNQNDEIQMVCELDERDKNSVENVNQLEELLRKSRQLNSSKTVRLIDQQIETVQLNLNSSVENLILSCNKLGQTNEIDWIQLPNHLKTLDLSANFLCSIDQIQNKTNQIQSLGVSFNEISQVNEIFANNKWSNLCSLDLSYNLLSNLKETVESLEHLNKLRILFLHGNPISLIVDYRVYVIDCLGKLEVLDDTRITTEERFRSRHFSKSSQHPKDYSSFKITFGTVENVPMPIVSEVNPWPIEVHRYKMRLNWFDGQIKEIEIPFDKFANFNRFNQTFLDSTPSEYKPTIEFSPSYLDFNINQLIPFRDFLFHGTQCSFIDQLTEYWPPNDQMNEQKKKPDSKAEKDKKSESPPKKKKTEDLSKLVIRNDPTETILAQFHVDLRRLLDGDYQVDFTFQKVLQQQIDSIQQQQTVPTKKKDKDKESPQDKKRTPSSKSNKDKPKDKKSLNESQDLSIESIQPFHCSIQFQLQRFVAQQQII